MNRGLLAWWIGNIAALAVCMLALIADPSGTTTAVAFFIWLVPSLCMLIAVDG